MKYTWQVAYSYLAKQPDEIECESDDQLVYRLQAIADAHQGKPFGLLEFEFLTDQVDVFFRRNNRRQRFMVLMA